MENNTETIEKAYATKEIAIRLNISAQTVRKYAQFLENEGYIFIKSDSGARLFTEHDINAFQHFIELRKAKIAVETCSSIVTERFNRKAIQVVEGSNTNEITQYKKQYNEDITELKETMDKQMELIHKQNESIEELKQYIKSKLEQRDQLLLKAMDETMEIKKELSATTEMNNKKGWFKRLFSK